MDASVTDTAAEPKPSTGNALIRLLYLARGLRGFGDGFAIIILPAYLTALGYDAVAVGLVATASLMGTALLTLITGWIAPRHDLRALLIFGAGLMAATGLAFPAVEQFALIALVAFIGTVNPSGGDLGVLVPLEHAVLAKSAIDEAPMAKPLMTMGSARRRNQRPRPTMPRLATHSPITDPP